METFKIEGVILRTTDFGDANRVVTIYTKDFGKLELNAYGCRRAKSSMSGALQIFNHITAEVSHGAKVNTIREADVVNFYGNLTADIERLSYAAIFFEIVNRMTLPKFPEPELYNLLIKSLPALNNLDARIAALIGVCQFMEMTGFQLNYFECVHCGAKITGDAKISLQDGGAMCMNCFVDEDLNYPEDTRLAFAEMLKYDWQGELKLNQQKISSAEEILWRQVRGILGKELNSIKFIKQWQKN